jgi:chaperonin GroES
LSSTNVPISQNIQKPSTWYAYPYSLSPPPSKLYTPASSILPRRKKTNLSKKTKQSTTLKSIKSLAPLLDRVLVQRIKAEARTASGIYLPESSVKELNEAKVLAVGPGGLDKDGKRVSCSVAVGDKVLIPQVRLIFSVSLWEDF